MSMSKKDFIALADAIRDHDHYVANNWTVAGVEYKQIFTPDQLDTLATICKQSNPNFKRERWLEYIAGNCGPNGGPIKAK